MITALLLGTPAVLARMLVSAFQLWNPAPVSAIPLYAGSRLPKQSAWLVPVAAMVITDAPLDGHRSRPWLGPSRLAIPATYVLTTLMGSTTTADLLGTALL